MDVRHVSPAETYYRITRIGHSPIALPPRSIAERSGRLGYNFGGRWDDPNGSFRVLYLSEHPRAAFLERFGALASSVRRVADLERLAAIDIGDEPDDPIDRIVIPQNEFEVFALSRVRVGAGVVADMRDPAWTAAVAAERPGLAREIGEDGFRPESILGDDRHVTQAISRYVFERAERFAGLRAPSAQRAGSQNVVLFENLNTLLDDRDFRIDVELLHEPQPLTLDYPYVREALEEIGIEICAPVTYSLYVEPASPAVALEPGLGIER